MQALAEERMERGQDARLMPLILEVMSRAELDFPQLDRIAVTRGPGSFTGLRISLAAARGIGLAADKPVVGIDRFRIYREQYKTHLGNFLVVLQSKRQELFCCSYPASGETAEPCMLMPEEIASLTGKNAPLMVVGDAQELLRGLLPPSTTVGQATQPEVVTSAVLAAGIAINDPDFLARPLYLRAPDVTFAKTGPENGCCT